MFLGQAVVFSRSGNTLTVGGETVGAVHLEQNGYTQARLQGTGGTLDKTYDLEGGHNLLTFPNVALTSISATFTGAGTVAWSSAGVFMTEIALTDEGNRDRPRTYAPIFSVPRATIHGTASKVAGQFGFEWRYLDWAKVDILEGIFDRHGALEDPEMTLIPDGYEGERYRVVITSPFDFYPSVEGNFNSGASGALVFDTV